MTTAILVARMGSTRFPGKTMQPIIGRPMIERLVDRIRKARCVDQMVLATTEGPEDDSLAEWALRTGLACHRGPADDVLGRIHQAWSRFGGETIVELLGDNPLVHGSLIEAVIERYRAGGHDYAVNVTCEYPYAPSDLARFPVGIRAQVYSAQLLERLVAVAHDPLDREHSTRYVAEHPKEFSVGYLAADGPWGALHRSDWTFAVNDPQNLEFIREIFSYGFSRDPNFTLQEVMRGIESGAIPLRGMGAPTPAPAAERVAAQR